MLRLKQPPGNVQPPPSSGNTPASPVGRPGLPDGFSTYTDYVESLNKKPTPEPSISSKQGGGKKESKTGMLIGGFKDVENTATEVAKAFPPFGLAAIGVLKAIKLAIVCFVSLPCLCRM